MLEKPPHACFKSIISPPMRYAIYARKSTESEDRQIQSLEDQIRELTHLANREGCIVTEIFQESRSAKAPGNRPEFDRLMQEIENGTVDGVLTWSINRLSRNPVDGGRIAYLLQTGKLSKIRTTDRTYLPDDNALILSIENGMATAYIQDLSRSVRRGMKGKFERGWQNSKAPLGYKNDAESREIVPDPDRFDLVRHAWDMLLSENFSVRQIALYLQSRGLTAFTRKGRNQVVSSTTIYKVFRKPFYAGRITFNELEKIGSHRPMVTEEEFERAQEILDRGKNSPRIRRASLPFQGVLRCATCGCAVVGETKCKSYTKTSRTVKYTYYHCSGARGCAKASMREEEIVDLCIGLSKEIAISKRFRSWLRDTSVAVLEYRSQRKPGVEDVRFEIDKQVSRLDALVALRADGEIGQAEFARNREQILSAIKELESRDRHVKSRPARLLRTFDSILEAGQFAHKVSQDHVESCVQLLKKVGCGVFQPGKLHFTYHPILSKIAALEPQFVSSEIAKSGEIPAPNSFWWRKVELIINLLEVSDVQ